MLDICSELFTGTQIKSAKFDHWKVDFQPGTSLSYKKKHQEEDEDLSLAEIKKKGNLRAK